MGAAHRRLAFFPHTPGDNLTGAAAGNEFTNARISDKFPRKIYEVPKQGTVGPEEAIP